MNEIPIQCDFTATVTIRAKEEIDKFVFETIKPFCEEITLSTLSKQELIKALERSKPKEVHAKYDLCNLPYNVSCPTCHYMLDVRFHFSYCPNCGQHLSWQTSLNRFRDNFNKNIEVEK